MAAQPRGNVAIDQEPACANLATMLASADTDAARRERLVRGVGSILLAALLIGVMASCVRVASRELSGPQIAFVRFFGSFLLLLLANTPGRLRPRAGNLRWLLARALFGTSSILLYYTAIQWSGAGMATMLHCTYPVSTALIAVVFLRERLTTALVLALGLELVGLFLVIGPGAGLSPLAVLGAACAIGASLLAGAALTTARHLRSSEDAWLITTYFMGIGAIVALPFWLATPPQPSSAMWLPLAGVVLTSVASQWLVHHGLGYTSASLGSLAAATSVISATACEALFLGESMSPRAWLGGAAMIVAVGFAIRRSD